MGPVKSAVLELDPDLLCAFGGYESMNREHAKSHLRLLPEAKRRRMMALIAGFF